MPLFAPPLRSRHPSGRRGQVRVPWMMWALVLALLSSLALSPLLSRMHQLVHPGHGVAAMRTAAVPLQRPAEASPALTPAERGPLDRLFGSHGEGTQACQLLDQGHASDGAGSQTAWVFAARVEALQPRGVLTAPTSCNFAFWEARGPPAFL
jgi:hypothetical protein